MGITDQQLDANLVNFSTLSKTANNFIVANGSSWITTTPADVRARLEISDEQLYYPFTINQNTAQTVDSWAIATYRTAVYAIQLKQTATGKYQFCELRVLHDGTNTYVTEFAVLNNGNMGTNGTSPPLFTATISSGTLSLKATIDNAAANNVNLILTRKLFVV